MDEVDESTYFFYPIVIEQVLGQLKVDDLLINASRVCKRFRHTVVHSPLVWINSYSATWGVSSPFMENFHNWKELALTRYKLKLCLESHTFGSMIMEVQKSISKTQDPALQSKLGNAIQAAYKNIMWYHSAMEKLQVVFDEPSPLIRDTTGIDILCSVMRTLRPIHTERTVTKDENGDEISFVKAQFVIYNVIGIPCFFEYMHRRPMDIIVNNKVKFMSLKINDELIFECEAKFKPGNIALLKTYLLGPKANEVSNDFLIASLCTTGASADKWATNSPLFGTADLQLVFIPALLWAHSVSKKSLEAVDFGKLQSKMLFALPECVSLVRPYPLSYEFAWVNFDNIGLQVLKWRQNKISNIRKKDVGYDQTQFDAHTKNLSEMKLVKSGVRYSSTITQQVRLWLQQAVHCGYLSMGEFDLYNELTPLPNFKVLDLDKAKTYHSCAQLTSCSFISLKTGKPIHLWYRFCRQDRTESVLLYFNGFRLISHANRLVEQHYRPPSSELVEASALQEQEGDLQYQERMANIFAKVKLDLFGSVLAPVKLVTLLQFLVVLVHSNTWTHKANDILPLSLANLIIEFAVSHKVAWDHSHNPTKFDQLQSDMEIKNDAKAKDELEANRIRLKKEMKLQKQKDQVSQSPAIVSKAYRVCAYKGATEPKPCLIHPIPASAACLTNTGFVLVDAAQWPPKIIETEKNLNKVVFSADGRRYAGFNYRLRIPPMGHRFGPKSKLGIYIYETFNSTPVVKIIAFRWVGKNTAVGFQNEEEMNAFQKENYADTPPSPVDMDPEYEPFVRGEPRHGRKISEFLDPLGFIDGKLLLGTKEHVNRPCVLQTSPSSTVFKRVNLPSYRGFVLRLPFQRESNFSQEGVMICGRIYRLDRNKNNFYPVKIVDVNAKPFAVDLPTHLHGMLASIEKDNRVFCIQYNRLYELLWTSPNTLMFMEHIPGLYAIQRIQSAESLGLILTCTKLNPHYSPHPSHHQHSEAFHLIYQPHKWPLLGPLRKLSSPLFGLLPSNENSVSPIRNLLWSEQTQMLITLEDNPPNMKTMGNTCNGCGGFTPDEFIFEKDDIIICRGCYRGLPNREGYVLRTDVMGAPVPDKKLDSQSVFRAVKLQNILALPAFTHADKKVDLGKLAADRQFVGYSPIMNSAKFSILPSVGSRINKLYLLTERIELSFVYTCFAYWERTPNCIPNSFLAPVNHHQVCNNPADLVASFLGGPVLFKPLDGNIRLGVIVDFKDCQKSDCVIMVHAHREDTNLCAEVMLSSLQWIGILGYFPESSVNEQERKHKLVEAVKCNSDFVKRVEICL